MPEIKLLIAAPVHRKRLKVCARCGQRSGLTHSHAPAKAIKKQITNKYYAKLFGAIPSIYLCERCHREYSKREHFFIQTALIKIATGLIKLHKRFVEPETA